MRMTTRVLLGVFALTLVVSLVPGTQKPSEAASPTPDIMFGTNVGSTATQTMEETVTATETELGRELAAVRVYEKWGVAFPSRSHQWLASTGHTMYLSVKSVRYNGDVIKWQDIAAAKPGDALYEDMVQMGRRFRDFGQTIYFIFNHEPEAQASRLMGTNEDFKAAWRKIHDVFDSVGATNVEYTWVMTGWSFRAPKSDPRYAQKWYPGNAYVDEIGADPYNWYDCQADDYPWRDAQFSLDPIRTFGKRHPHKELMLAEYATVEDKDNPGRKAEWIKELTTLLKQPGWEQFHTILYYHSVGTSEPTCIWNYDTSTQAENALASMGADPYFQGVE